MKNLRDFVSSDARERFERIQHMIERISQFELYEEWGISVDPKFTKVKAEILPKPQILDPEKGGVSRDFVAYEKRQIEHFEELILNDDEWLIIYKQALSNKVQAMLGHCERAGQTLGVSLGYPTEVPLP